MRTAKQTPNRPGVRRVLSAVAMGVGFLALIFALFVALVAIVVPTIAGAQPYTVLTQSMAPGMPPGTYLIVRPTPTDQLQIGDVITYQLRSGEPEVVTHRIVEKTTAADGTARFVTQGDNNANADPTPIREVQIRGKVWYAIPYLGWVANYRDQHGDLWVPIAAGLLFGYAGVQVGWWGYRKLRPSKPRHRSPHEAVL